MQRISSALQRNPNLARLGWFPPIYILGLAWNIVILIVAILFLPFMSDTWLKFGSAGPFAIVDALFWPSVLRQEYLQQSGRTNRVSREDLLSEALESGHLTTEGLNIQIDDSSTLFGVTVITTQQLGPLFMATDRCLYYAISHRFFRVRSRECRALTDEEFKVLIRNINALKA